MSNKTELHEIQAKNTWGCRPMTQISCESIDVKSFNFIGFSAILLVETIWLNLCQNAANFLD